GDTLIEDASSDIVLRISSVGQETVEGKACRWIEFKTEEKINGQMQSIVFKLLIPEEQLKRGGDPAEHIARGWLKGYDKTIVSIKNVDKRPLGLILPGAIQDVKTLDSRTVDCKIGKLDCKGLSGTTSSKDDAGLELTSIQEIRLHEKSPFGVAFWESRTEMDDQKVARMTITMSCTLSESGTSAKSELPDHN
ncbi:MAG: hypothetical protein O2856_05820, partial [Planctomycetota bacterium]|nr:hypothetical protein [Planctomycetota bacterium]